VDLDDRRLFHCGHFVVPLGAVPHKRDDEAGAGGTAVVIRPAMVNPAANASPEWRGRLRGWLRGRDPLWHVRL